MSRHFEMVDDLEDCRFPCALEQFLSRRQDVVGIELGVDEQETRPGRRSGGSTQFAAGLTPCQRRQRRAVVQLVSEIRHLELPQHGRRVFEVIQPAQEDDAAQPDACAGVHESCAGRAEGWLEQPRTHVDGAGRVPHDIDVSILARIVLLADPAERLVQVFPSRRKFRTVFDEAVVDDNGLETDLVGKEVAQVLVYQGSGFVGFVAVAEAASVEEYEKRARSGIIGGSR